MYRERLREKLIEALKAVLPIVCIVLLLSFTIAPLPASILLAYLFGGLLLILGMMFFSLGAELAMQPMGEQVGAGVTKSRKLWLILPVGFVLGTLITVSEPDLKVLADQVPSIPSPILIWGVAIGVGLFLLLALIRMLFGVSLNVLLIACYGLTFVLAIFAPHNFLAVAFDSGGVTTGPMTVPFIMAFGIGISSIRSDRKAAEDSFGLIALCSVGPILTVMILSLIFHPENADYTPAVIPVIEDSAKLAKLFTDAFPDYFKEIAISVLPIVLFYFFYRLIHLYVNRMQKNRRSARRILVGLLYAYIGLVLFLTGSSVGFMPAGAYLGKALAGLPYRWIIIPLGMVIGYFIVAAEPAVYVLMRQVEELTSGAIRGKTLRISLSIGVSTSIGLAMLRVLTGVPVLWMLVPGYGIALLLSFFVPKLFTAIAFDSGGVVSGPMTAAFLLPFAMGACSAVGGNFLTDAFGVVAMVAMTPLITIQVLGLVSTLRSKQCKHAPETEAPDDNYTIIEL